MGAAPHAQIVGGGIAGFAAGVALLRQGFRVTVFERAQHIREFGAGLQITPNGMRVLHGLGLGPQAESAGLPAEAVAPMDGLSGRQVACFDLARQQPRYRFFHRADLLSLLLEAAKSAGAEVVTGAAIIAEDPRLNDDIVIGAGGVHCPLRQQICPSGAPFFTGQVAWRAVISGQAAPVARIWMGPGRHLVSYPLPGGRINLVAVQERTAWAKEGWSHSDSPDALRAAFADFAPPVQALLAQVEDVHLWGLFRHPIAERWWGKDNRVLLGDSVHPTLPFLAQGANLALEDAWVLAACAPSCDWTRYQALRRDRVCRAIAAANANARAYHLRGAARQAAHLALTGLGRVAPGAFINRLSWLYDFDVTRHS